MLFLAGIGLTNRDVTSSALVALKNSELLLDQYTNYIEQEDINHLEGLFGKGIKPLERSDLEENAIQIVNRARSGDVAILVSGDPLIATTHHTILDLAEKNSVQYGVFHSSNIFSAAIGQSGLDIYKFGPPTTITFWSENYKPISFIDVIKKNIANDEHTLALFDYHYKEKRRMRLGEAIPLLHTADEQRKYGIMTPDRKLLIMGDVGKQTQTIEYVEFGKIDKRVLKKFENKVISIIVPGKMNFAEEEAIHKFTSSSI
ncbi:MAG: diphthine synthase [Candidatus Micrarchaeales archaeon]